MKVALVIPAKEPFFNAPCPPLNLGYIASYLKKEIPNCEIRIIDGEAGHDVEEELLNFQPNIVGVSASTSQAFDAYDLGDKQSADILTVIGGCHASVLPEESLEHFDCVVVGEGEIVFAKIVQDLIDGKRSSGIIQGTEIEDLNTLPPIDYNLFDMAWYLKYSAALPLLDCPCMTIIASRGCPFRCPFCYNSGRSTKVRYFSSERIAQEIQSLHDKYGIKRFYFGDDDFLINLVRLKELKELFDKKGISAWINWGCQSRSKNATISTLELIKSFGCVLCSWGLESGCERTLNYLKCGTTTLADHETALRNCEEVGILAGGNFIYGVFDQTLDEMKESFRWLTKQKNISFVGTGLLIPYPGTEVWKKSQELKLLPENVDYSRLKFTSDVKETYILNQVVPINKLGKLVLEVARMSRLYAKRNYLKSGWQFTLSMWKKPVYYWAWLNHPIQMFNITFRGNKK